MNPMLEREPLFAAAEISDPDPDPAFDSPSPAAPPSAEPPRHFRYIQRNQPTWMIVDLERMLEESHPARGFGDIHLGFGDMKL